MKDDRRTMDGRNSRSAIGNRESALFWLSLILLFAAGLRFWALGAKSLWLDEILTVRNASGSFGWMIAELKKFDAHPPLFQIIEWLWLRLGEGDAFSRIPAALAGIAGVWLAWRAARRLMGRRVGLAAALLLAVSYFHVYYSQEARLYSLVMTIFLAQVCLLLRLIAARGRAGWKWWAAYAALGVVSLYTYVLCALTLAALALAWLWLTRPGRRQWAHWIAAHLVIGLLFLPWFPVMQRITAGVNASIQIRGGEVGRPGPDQIALSAAAWAFGPPRWQRHQEIGCGLGVAAVLLAALSLGRRRGRRPGKLLLVLFVVPLAGYLILPMPRVQFYDPKHLCYLQPLLMIGLASLVAAAGTARTRIAFYVLLAPVLLLNLAGLRDYERPGYQKENWRRMAAEVYPQLNPRDGILFSPPYVGFAFEHYAGGAEARARVHALAERGSEMPPDLDRLWLIECRNLVSYLNPDPQRDETAREAMLKRIESAGWAPRESKTYFGALGRLKWTLLLPSGPHPSGTPP